MVPSVDLQTKQVLLEEYACDSGFSVAKLQKKKSFGKKISNIFWMSYSKKQTACVTHSSRALQSTYWRKKKNLYF